MSLSSTQRTILQALSDGDRIVWSDRTPPVYYLEHARTLVPRRRTLHALSHARFITLAGTLEKAWYEITNLGRRALERDRT